MKKLVIISAIVLSSAAAALSISKKDKNEHATELKISKSDFAIKQTSVDRTPISTAD